MSWKDRKYQVDEVSYPFVQWINNGGSLEPRESTGGFACPVDQGVDIPGAQPAVVHHRNGNTTDVLFSHAIEVAVIKTRFAWVKDGIRQPSYTKGARGKVQALCYVRGADQAGLVMLTFAGLAGKSFGEARKGFASAVRKATKGKAPAYAFWMTVQSGEVKMVGRGTKSPITTIEWKGGFDPDSDYIGDDLVDSIPWDEVNSWAQEWNTPGPNGSGEVVHEQEQDPLEWAKNYPVPIRGQSFPKGTPMGELKNAVLEYILRHSEELKIPQDAVRAANIILEAQDEEDEIPF